MNDMTNAIQPLILDRNPGIADLCQAARWRAQVILAPAAEARLHAARRIVEQHMAAGAPVYGLTMGLGATADTRLDLQELVAYQRRVIPARAVGVGPKLPADAVRAMMFARLAGLAAGGSGCSPELARALADALNAGFHPQVPSIGSIGAGDLAPLAHMSLALMGEGEAEVGGEVMPAGAALKRAGLELLQLQAKDGHVLIAANSLSVGRGALAVRDIGAMLDTFRLAWSMSLEAFRGNVSPIDPRSCAARPVPGQAEEAQAMRALLAGSQLMRPGQARRLQDPLSFRCAVQVHGSARAALALVHEAVETELASPADNPVVLAEEGVILANGNFDMTGFVLRFEMLGQALAHVATLSAQRSIKLMAEHFSGLPRFLTPRGPSRNGFQTAQKTISALESDIRQRAMPVPLSLMPVSDSVEDHAANAPAAVAKTHEMVDRLAFLAAIELCVSSQALDLAKPGVIGAGPQRGYDTVRSMVEFLDEDRALGPDFDRVAEAVFAGKFG